MKKVVRVQGRAVGAGHPTFLIAEIGTNHNGDLNLALEMVKAAAASGADAVKFQTVCADASYIEGSFAYNVFKKIWLDCEQLARIKRLAEEKGLIFFSSPADLVGAQLLKELGPPAVKISSFSVGQKLMASPTCTSTLPPASTLRGPTNSYAAAAFASPAVTTFCH